MDLSKYTDLVITCLKFLMCALYGTSKTDIDLYKRAVFRIPRLYILINQFSMLTFKKNQ